MRVARVLGLALVIATTSVRGQDSPALVRCRHPRPTAFLAEDPLLRCAPPQTAWCDRADALVQCCGRGTTWNGSQCACDSNRHLDHGLCCAANEHWSGAGGAETGNGYCCPEGTQGLDSASIRTDVGFVGGDVVFCCPPGQQLDGSGCYEPMPCESTGHGRRIEDGTGGSGSIQFSSQMDEWLDCQGRAMRHAGTGTARAAVTVGPTSSGDAAANDAIRAAVQGETRALRACYTQALATHASLAGFALVYVETQPDGRIVAQVRPRLGDLPGDLLDCIGDALSDHAHVAATVRTGSSAEILLAFQHPSPRPSRRPRP